MTWHCCFEVSTTAAPEYNILSAPAVILRNMCTGAIPALSAFCATQPTAGQHGLNSRAEQGAGRVHAEHPASMQPQSIVPAAALCRPVPTASWKEAGKADSSASMVHVTHSMENAPLFVGRKCRRQGSLHQLGHLCQNCMACANKNGTRIRTIAKCVALLNKIAKGKSRHNSQIGVAEAYPPSCTR